METALESLPAFSIDKSVAVFYYCYNAGGGNEGRYIYKKINGKWKCVGQIGFVVCFD